MTIPKTTAAQFVEQLKDGILSRNADYDVTTGPIPDLSINPQARVFERVNDRARKVNLLMSLANANEFEGDYEADLDGVLFNEQMVRSPPSVASAVLTFHRSAAPTARLVIPRGYPVGSQPDEGTGSTVTFVTSEEKRVEVADAASYFDPVDGRYEVSVAAVATATGTTGQVGANRITRRLRAPIGFDGIFNAAASAGGRDRESNADAIARYLLAVLGRDLTTPFGLERAARDDFSDASDLLVVHGANALLTRDDTDPGAVDVYVRGAVLQERTESLVFLGIGQLIAIGRPPLVSVLSVQNLAGPTTFTAGTDYDVVFDATGDAASTRAVEGVRFRAGGTSPAVGTVLTITYSYDNLIRTLQAAFELDDHLSVGRDLLFKRGTEVAIVLEADLRVLPGFNTTTIQEAVEAGVLAFVNNTAGTGLGLGGDVEGSDIQGVVRALSGVDNFIIRRLTRATVASGTADIIITDQEYPSLSSGNLVITLI